MRDKFSRLTELEKAMGVPIIGGPSSPPNRETYIKTWKKRIYAGSACVVLAAVAAACKTSDHTADTLPPLGTNPPTTTIAMESITSTTTLPMTGCGPQETIAKGDTLIKISNRCNIPLASIVAWNNIVDSNYVQAGQSIILTEPSTTTTLTPETTAVAETTLPPETVPADTTPPETLPLPPPPQPNDWFLSAKACADLGGTQYRFKAGEYLGATLKRLDGYADNQIAAFLATDIPDTFHIRQITASTDGNVGAECLAPKALIDTVVPAPRITTTTVKP